MCLTFTVSGHLEPEFVDVVQNITVPVGRDVKFSCHVRHLGTSYKVSFSFRLFLFLYISIPFFLPFLFISKNFIASFLFCPLFSWGPKSPVHSPQSDWRFRLGLLCCRRHFMAGPIRILLLLPLSGNFSLSSIPSISSLPPIAVVHSPFRRCPSIQLAPLSQETLFPCLPLPVFCWTFESARLYSLPLPLQLLLSRVDNLVCLSSREHTVHHSALLPNTINTWALPSRRLLS